jgi:hypothetical protein
MEDPFAVKELRIRQPVKVMAGGVRFDLYDGRNLVAVVAETALRTRLQTISDLVPRTRTLGVRTAAGEPLLTLVRRDGDTWLTDVNDADGQLIGQIETGETRRHYTLFDENGQLAGSAEGDLAVRQFTISGPDGERYARLRKTWAGLGKELLTSSDHYTLTFIGPMPPKVRTLVAMVPIVLDMARHGPY